MVPGEQSPKSQIVGWIIFSRERIGESHSAPIMFGLCCRRLQLLLVPSCSICVTHFDYIQKAHVFSRYHSSKSSVLGSEIDDKPQGHSFTVAYLINSCGLSPQLALSASKKMRVQFESPEKPDLVIKLLKHYGLNETHISQLVKKCPILLIYNADKTLLPKLEFFSSIGLSGTDLARIFRFNANILTLSLDTSIRPCYDIMKSLQIPQEKIPYFISNYHLFNAKVLTNVARNIPVLKAHDVPQSSFPLWVPLYFTALAFDAEKVEANVKRVMSMGFLPSSTTFMRALYVISVTDASKWEQKMKFYNKWGWTEHDVLLAFRKNPMYMAFSEKNVSAKMDFLLNKMGCQPADLAGRPDILAYSLEKRIIPRCSVIRLLQLKGLIVREDLSIITIVHKNEKWFLERFVTKYQEQVPELLSILQGKMGLAEFGLGFDGRGGVKQL